MGSVQHFKAQSLSGCSNSKHTSNLGQLMSSEAKDCALDLVSERSRNQSSIADVQLQRRRFEFGVVAVKRCQSAERVLLG